jgi:hypothetical protein
MDLFLAAHSSSASEALAGAADEAAAGGGGVVLVVLRPANSKVKASLAHGTSRTSSVFSSFTVKCEAIA